MLFRSKVFDPFFSTKGEGEGLGLGLSIAYKAVQGHGGDITVSGEQGVGTVVTIVLPHTEEMTFEAEPNYASS